MKKILTRFSAGLSALSLAFFMGGCVAEVPEVIETLNTPNLLTPTTTTANVSTEDGQTVTFTWANSRGAVSYHLEVYAFLTEDENTPKKASDITEEILATATKIVDENVTPAESGSTSSYKKKIDPEYSLYARVCAQSSTDPETKTVGDSKWAVFGYPIDTYTVMPAIKSLTVTERTQTTITVAWELNDGDNDGINQLRITPDPTGAEGSAYYKRVLTDEEIQAKQAVIGTADLPLTPSVKYDIRAHYNSANRAQVFAWTRPSIDRPTEVDNSEKLINALREGAKNILVKYSTEPYVITTGDSEALVDVVIAANGFADTENCDINVYGESLIDGSMPTIIGRFTVPNGLKSLHLEGLNFDGDSYRVSHVISMGTGLATDVTSISMLNCNVTGYKHGFYYYNSGCGAVTVQNLSFNNIMVSDTEGVGGNGFDIREQATIGTISITESTFTDGMRTFFRIDKATTEKIVIDNNTFNNLCYIDDGNNKGLFYIGGGKGEAKVNAFELTDNLFINLDAYKGTSARQVFFSDEVGVPTKISNNFYYKVNKTFWASEQDKDGNTINGDGLGELTQTQGLQGEGQMLSADPCYNSDRGIFNITNSTVLSAKAGDPRWLVSYIEPEMPFLTSVNADPAFESYTWNLTDMDVFYETIDANTRLGNIQFIVDSTPIKVSEDGFTFTGAATTEYAGVPIDGAIAFLVSNPGSVVVSTAASTTINNHITVAYGPVDPDKDFTQKLNAGKTAAVHGSISGGADRNRVVFTDLDMVPGEEYMVYLYACGPVTMTGLGWISATETLNPQKLATPTGLALTATEGDETSGDVTLSWTEANKAVSYDVNITCGATTETVNVTGTSYTISPKDLGVGTYTYTIVARPADGDMALDPSDESESVSYLRNSTMSAVSSYVPTSWGSEDMKYMYDITGGVKFTSPDYVYKNMKFLAGENTISFVSANNSAGEAAYAFSSGGGGSTSKRALQFMVPGPGTLKFEARSGDEDRYVKVLIGDTEYTAASSYNADNGGYTAPGKNNTADGTHTLDLTEETIAAGTVISLYSKSKGINFFSVTWTPSGYDPDAELPAVAGLTPVNTATTWGADVWAALYERRTDSTVDYEKDFYIEPEYFVQDNLMIYSSTSENTAKFRVGKSNAFVQMASKSYSTDAASYNQCFLRFRANGNGTLVVKARSTSGASDSKARILGVVVGGDADKTAVGTVHSTSYDLMAVTSFTEYSWKISATNGDPISIIQSDAIRVESVTWTPDNDINAQ